MLCESGSACMLMASSVDVDEMSDLWFLLTTLSSKGSYECSCMKATILLETLASFGTAQLYIALQDSQDHGEIRSYDLHTKEYLETVAGIDKPLELPMTTFQQEDYLD